jgi:hypothetical protein
MLPLLTCVCQCRIDGSDVHAITGLLANLESVDLLKPDSDVRNLHFVMAQYLILASEMRKYNLMIRPRSKVTSMLTSWRMRRSIRSIFKAHPT